MSPLLGFGIIVALLIAWLIHRAGAPPSQRWSG
jgi:hypothetical protein